MSNWNMECPYCHDMDWGKRLGDLWLCRVCDTLVEPVEAKEEEDDQT